MAAELNKSSLRQEYIRKRNALEDGELQQKNVMILQKIRIYLKNRNFQILHVFLPQLNSSEIDTWKIIDMIRQEYPSVLIASPYIIPGTREMDHYQISPETSLIENQWKIPEPDPSNSQKVENETIDIIFIPLLTFDLKGYRVGYGGGYYDRFLKRCRPDAIKIGLSFFDPVEKIGDIDQYDVPLNVCVTPTAIHYF